MLKTCPVCNGEFQTPANRQKFCSRDCFHAGQAGDNHHMRRAVADGTSIRLDLGGRTFGRWTVLGFSHRVGVTMMWSCRCECGTERAVKASSLTGEASRSCGCLQRELTAKKSTSHGHSRTPIYGAWRNMVARCHRPASDEYHRYGARGITVCDRWRADFANFLEDMGERPSPEMTVERIDNDGNYEPGNCRWATPLEQGQNRRNSRLVEFNGETRTISAWAKLYGLTHNGLRYRLNKGWPVEVALNTPSDKSKPHVVKRVWPSKPDLRGR